jgi:predicted enzyme related to lactoylglutathione lyase
MSDTKVTGIDITVYPIVDPARAKAFYRDTMELPMSEEEEQGAEFILSDGTTFGIWKMDDGHFTPTHGVMFAVPNIHKAVAHYRAKGVKIMEHVEETRVCHMAFAEDSEGNHFILHQRKTG